MKRIIQMTALAGLLAWSPQQLTAQEKSATTVAKNTVQVTYKLKGFNQSCCYGMVNFILEEQAGYIKSEPNMELQQITVWFDPSKSTEAEIKKAINETPYKIIETVK